MYYSESLSFDPRDPLFPVPEMPGVRWGVVVYTVASCLRSAIARAVVLSFIE